MSAPVPSGGCEDGCWSDAVTGCECRQAAAFAHITIRLMPAPEPKPRAQPRKRVTR